MRQGQDEADPEPPPHVGFHGRGHARITHIVAGVGHARVLSVLDRLSFGSVRYGRWMGSVRVVMGRNHCIG